MLTNFLDIISAVMSKVVDVLLCIYGRHRDGYLSLRWWIIIFPKCYQFGDC